jgi:hypothetical protein
LTDVPILAVHTAKIAPAEENRTGAVPAPQRILFAVVWAVAVHDGTLARPAYGTFDGLQPVHAAVPGTEIAIFQAPPGIRGTLREFARFGEFEITGLHGGQ